MKLTVSKIYLKFPNGKIKIDEKRFRTLNLDRHERRIDVHVVERGFEESSQRKHIEENSDRSGSDDGTRGCRGFSRTTDNRIC